LHGRASGEAPYLARLNSGPEDFSARSTRKLVRLALRATVALRQRYFANNRDGSLNALNSSALPDGS
jgi:hypothetical protein